MGFFDLFRLGRVLLGTAKAVRAQRRLARELAALPMERFVPECMSYLNRSAGNWEGRARPRDAAAAEIARAHGLPEELIDFYRVCDGFEAVSGEFPACIPPVAQLRTGARHVPPLSSLLSAYWDEHGNDSDRPGLLSVLPPDDLAALAVHAADDYLEPAMLDSAIVLGSPDERGFVVVLPADAGGNLARGTVLDVEAGAATWYPGFKAWLATRASLYAAF